MLYATHICNRMLVSRFVARFVWQMVRVGNGAGGTSSNDGFNCVGAPDPFLPPQSPPSPPVTPPMPPSAPPALTCTDPITTGIAPWRFISTTWDTSGDNGDNPVYCKPQPDAPGWYQETSGCWVGRMPLKPTRCSRPLQIMCRLQMTIRATVWYRSQFGSSSLVGGGAWELRFQLTAAQAQCAHLEAQFVVDESAVFSLNGARELHKIQTKAVQPPMSPGYR